MNTSIESLTAKIRDISASVTVPSAPVVLIGVFALLLVILSIQSSCDRRAALAQSSEAAIYQKQTAILQQESAILQGKFEAQHEMTVSVLDSIKDVTVTINKLAENDLRFDAQVQNLQQNYEKSKQPVGIIPKNGTYRAPRANAPLSEREKQLLANDKFLYGDGAANR